MHPRADREKGLLHLTDMYVYGCLAFFDLVSSIDRHKVHTSVHFLVYLYMKQSPAWLPARSLSFALQSVSLSFSSSDVSLLLFPCLLGAYVSLHPPCRSVSDVSNPECGRKSTVLFFFRSFYDAEDASRSRRHWICFTWFEHHVPRAHLSRRSHGKCAGRKRRCKSFSSTS